MYQVAISTPIQLFFAWRIRLLTKQNILATLITILSLVSLGTLQYLCFSHCHAHPCTISAGGLWTTIQISIIKLFSRKPELHWSALVWFLSATVADVLITVTLVINLVCTEVWIEMVFTFTIYSRDVRQDLLQQMMPYPRSFEVGLYPKCVNIAYFEIVTVQTGMLT